MNYKHFIGIDVSKSWLDLTIMYGRDVLLYKRIDNSQAAIKALLQALKEIKEFDIKTTLVCMEHTGIYNNHLLSSLSKIKAHICLESGLQINQSSGIRRGKNDKIDSQRIAMYAYKNREDIRLWEPKREVITGLKHLTALRNRLLNALKQLKTPLKESSGFISAQDQKRTTALCKSSIKSIENDIKQVNAQIKKIILADPELNRLFNLICSVTGIGPVTATEIIITTNEFKSINCHKKYACYSGIAPFDKESGSSVKGKSRISSMGNMNVKKLLHLAALSASQCAGDLKIYYQRKVNEGKNKMAILNAIRNKLIARVFACVTKNRGYEKNYHNLLLYP